MPTAFLSLALGLANGLRQTAKSAGIALTDRHHALLERVNALLEREKPGPDSNVAPENPAAPA